MPLVGFEPAIPASEQLQTHALARAATGTDVMYYGIKMQSSTLGAPLEI